MWKAWDAPLDRSHTEHTTPEKTKMRMIDPYDTQKVRILAVTWNLHGKIPSNDEDLEILLKT